MTASRSRRTKGRAPTPVHTGAAGRRLLATALAAAAVAVPAGTALLLASLPHAVGVVPDSYRVADDGYRLVLTVCGSADASLIGATVFAQDSTRVVVRTTDRAALGASLAICYPHDVSVVLDWPLGTRPVVDAAGRTIPAQTP